MLSHLNAHTLQQIGQFILSYRFLALLYALSLSFTLYQIVKANGKMRLYYFISLVGITLIAFDATARELMLHYKDTLYAVLGGVVGPVIVIIAAFKMKKYYETVKEETKIESVDGLIWPPAPQSPEK